jgi:hypothetical protein
VEETAQTIQSFSHLGTAKKRPDIEPPYLKILSGILNGSSEIGYAKWDVGESCCRVWLQVQAETSEGLTTLMENRRLAGY